MTEPAKKSLLMQLLDVFGPLPGQSRLQFADEVKTLSQSDREAFAAMLTEAGFPCDVPQPQHVPAC